MDPVGQSVFLKTLGFCLINSLWQMAILWIACMLVTAAGRRFSATVRHVLTVGFLCAGLIWFVVSFILAFSLPLRFPFLPVDIASLIPIDGDQHFFIRSFGSLVNRAVPYCSVLYIVVLAFLFTRYSTYYLHSRRLSMEGLHRAQPHLRVFIDQLVQQLGIHKKVTLWFSSIADSPMTIGFLKSVILVPLATINQLTPAQVEAVLLHELAHIKRNDYFINLLITVTGILFFFNPFTRLFIRQIRKETENCCDDLVMQFRYDPHTYVSALLSLEKTRHVQQLAMAAVGGGNQALLERVKRITGHRNRPRYNGSTLALFFLVVFICCITAWFQPAPHPKSVFMRKVPVYKIAVELQPLVFTAAGTYSLQQPVVRPKKPVKKVKLHSNDAPAGNNYITLVNEMKQEGPEADDEGYGYTNITATVQPELARDYSIRQDGATIAPEAVGVSKDRFPYVPNSSFSFKVIADSQRVIRVKALRSEKMAEETMQKTLAELDGVDWDNFEGMGTLNKTAKAATGKSKLHKITAIQAAHNAADKDLSNHSDENETLRIKENINLQMQALQNSHSKTPLQIQVIEQQIYREKQKLYQENMKKLNESLKEIEAIRKKNKIVYI